MATYRTIVRAVDDIPNGEHLNEDVTATSFADLLTKATVTAAVTDAQTSHSGSTIVVKAYEPHSSDAVTGGAEDLVGSHYYVPTTVVFYTEHGQVTEANFTCPAAGGSYESSDDASNTVKFMGAENIYAAWPGITDSHGAVPSSSDNAVLIPIAFYHDVETVTVAVPNSASKDIVATKFGFAVPGGTAGEEDEETLTVTTTAVTTTNTAPEPNYTYAAGAGELTVTIAYS